MISKRQFVSLERARKIKALQRTLPPHPRDIIQAEMSGRGWTVAHLASRMNGDALRNRVLLSVYFRHPTGDLELGQMIAQRLGDAFGLSAEFFLDLEHAWRESQKARAA